MKREELRHEVKELQRVVDSCRLMLRRITDQALVLAALIEEAEALHQMIERTLAVDD